MRTGGRAYGIALAALILGGGAPGALAAQGRAADADEREIAAYRLSEATLAKFIRASRAMAAITKTMPADTAEDDGDESGPDDPSIAEIAAMYDSIPGVRRAITGAGLATREFVVFTLTMFSAGMAAWLVEQHGWDKLPPEIARENVLFYQRHKAQLDSLTAEMKQGEREAP
jgi:hypothetical protein